MKKKQKQIQELTDYELELLYRSLYKEREEIEQFITEVEQEKRDREIPYIKTKIGYKKNG